MHIWGKLLSPYPWSEVTRWETFLVHISTGMRTWLELNFPNSSIHTYWVESATHNFHTMGKCIQSLKLISCQFWGESWWTCQNIKFNIVKFWRGRCSCCWFGSCFCLVTVKMKAIFDCVFQTTEFFNKWYNLQDKNCSNFRILQIETQSFVWGWVEKKTR